MARRMAGPWAHSRRLGLQARQLPLRCGVKANESIPSPALDPAPGEIWPRIATAENRCIDRIINPMWSPVLHSVLGGNGLRHAPRRVGPATRHPLLTAIICSMPVHLPPDLARDALDPCPRERLRPDMTPASNPN